MAVMEYFRPDEERKYDFLEKVTEAEDAIGRSRRRIDPAAHANLLEAIANLRAVLASRRATSESFVRWRGMLSRCLEANLDESATLPDTASAEELRRCLGEIEREIGPLA